jgi:hypothetical protein
LCKPLDKRAAGGLARRSGGEEDLLQYRVPLEGRIPANTKVL